MVDCLWCGTTGSELSIVGGLNGRVGGGGGGFGVLLGYFSLPFSLVFSLKSMVIVRVVDEYCVVSSNREGGNGEGRLGGVVSPFLYLVSFFFSER